MIKIKPAGWAAIGLVTLVGAALIYKPSEDSNSSSSEPSTFNSFFSKDKSDEVTIIVNTYCGFAPIALLAEKYDKEMFGIDISLKVIDDFEACRAAFINNDAQMAYCTLDALPVEMSSSGVMASPEIDAVYFLPLNFSAGADAMVVNKSINTTQDLKGKKVAYAEGTASHTLLLNILETSGLKQEDIIPIKVSDGVAARDNFNAKTVDAACVWAPDDIECLKAVSGSKVLTSTKDAPLMISDGLIAKRAWLEKNKELATKVAEAIYWANSEVMHNQDKFDEAAEAFSKVFKFDVDIAKVSGTKINYMTIADAYNWMGLNTDYTGAVGSTIYTKMCTNYSSLKLCKSPLSWSAVSYLDIVKSLYKSNNLSNNQEETGTKTVIFNAPSNEDINKVSFSNKKVIIEFPTGSYTLTNEARAIIDAQFVDIAKEFANARIRVEGNTDATGSYDTNVALSKKRAQAVVNYLVSEYKMDPNRFISKGNGPKHAIEDGVKGPSAEYRTTEFHLVSTDSE